MRPTDILSAPPAPERIMATLERVGELLGLELCWLWRRAFHFVIGDGWTVALTPESAGRFRVGLYHNLRERTSVWVIAADEDRLAGVILDLAQEVGVREEV